MEVGKQIKIKGIEIIAVITFIEGDKVYCYSKNEKSVLVVDISLCEDYTQDTKGMFKTVR